MFHLKNPRLQFIFNRESEDLEKSFLDLKKTVDEKTFRYEVMMALWLCLNLKEIDAARTMLKVDEELVSTVLVNLRKNGEIMRERRIQREKERRKKHVWALQ